MMLCLLLHSSADGHEGFNFFQLSFILICTFFLWIEFFLGLFAFTTLCCLVDFNFAVKFCLYVYIFSPPIHKSFSEVFSFISSG